MEPKKTIVLVEDDDDTRETVSELLQEEGFNVLPFEDGLEFEDYLGLSSGQPPALLPDLIITDVMMPGRTGVDLLRAIRNAYPTVEVLLVTAYGQQKIYEELQGMHAIVIDKPFNLHEFLAVVRAHIAHAPVVLTKKNVTE